MNIEELERFSRDHADKEGFLLQPDEKLRGALLKGLLMREEKFGKRYCPCRTLTNNQKEDDKAICPCAYHTGEILRDGHCKCNLFLKKE